MLQLLGDPHEGHAAICYKCVGGLGPDHECSLLSGLVSVGPSGPGLVDSVGLLVVSLTPVAPSILLLILPQDFPCST